MSKVEARSFMLFLVVIGFFAVLGALLFVQIPQDNREYLMMLIVPLSTAFTSLLGTRPQVPPAKDGAP